MVERFSAHPDGNVGMNPELRLKADTGPDRSTLVAWELVPSKIKGLERLTRVPPFLQKERKRYSLALL